MNPSKTKRPFRRGCLFMLLYWLPTALIMLFVIQKIGGARQNSAFRTVIRDADRVVVRDGGFGCCCDVDKAQVFYVVTNKEEVIQFNNMFSFSGKGMGCKCCGDFGIDWWQGTNRIALTAVHHGETLQWKGFDGHYAKLTNRSANKILHWYLDHCDRTRTDVLPK